MWTKVLTVVAGLAAGAVAHGGHDHEQEPIGPHKSLWYNTLPGDGGTQVCCCWCFLGGRIEGLTGLLLYRPIRCFRVSRRLVDCRISRVSRAMRRSMILRFWVCFGPYLNALFSFCVSNDQLDDC